MDIILLKKRYPIETGGKIFLYKNILTIIEETFSNNMTLFSLLYEL